MKIVVLGGSGFLGSHVSDELSKRGHKVTIFDKKKSRWIKPNQKFYLGNVLDSSKLEKVIKNADIVFHFAALADLSEALKQPINSVKLNILATVLALDLCRKHKVKRFIFASTIYVNSMQGGFYRSSKKAAEDYIEEYKNIYGLNYTILRFGSLYGPRSDNSNGIRLMVKNAIKDKILAYSGTKKTVRKYIHVYDAAKACAETIKKRYQNEYLTITGKKKLSINTFLKNLAKILKINKKIKFSNKNLIGHYETNPYTFKFKKGKVLNYKSKVNFRYAILQLINEIKKNN